MDAAAYWNAVIRQDRSAMADFFCADARVDWHNTNGRFTVEEFLRANCEYPGNWAGKVERIVTAGDLIITAARVWETNGGAACHVVSFMHLRDGKIQQLEEYWGDDGEPPRWRQKMGIGKRIR